MDNDYFTEEELSGAGTNDNVEASDSNSAESPVTPQQGAELTLAELNAVLGKNFTSKDAALKSIKDTSSYVGAKRDKIKEEVLAELGDKIIFKDQYETDMFYKENAQFGGLRDVIDAMAKANNQRPHEVVKTESFSKLFESVTGYEQTQRAKTVLSSNPRIASSSNAIAEARKAQASGDDVATEQFALQAVKDAYEMN